MAAQPGNCLNPNGRPRKEIDWSMFEQLCGFQCTQSEIASMLKIHIDTLRDRAIDHYEDDYSSIYKKYSESGKCSLRRNQFVLSKKNAAMAIWLGKMWLGQKDDNEVKEIIIDVVRDAVREIARDSGIKVAGRPILEDKQSLLHQEQGREESPVQTELGTAKTLGRSSSSQDHSQG